MHDLVTHVEATIAEFVRYISRLENGQFDIQLSTLYRIFEFGLEKRTKLHIAAPPAI